MEALMMEHIFPHVDEFVTFPQLFIMAKIPSRQRSARIFIARTAEKAPHLYRHRAFSSRVYLICVEKRRKFNLLPYNLIYACILVFLRAINNLNCIFQV